MLHSTIAVVAGCFAMANGHILMTSPKPFDYFAGSNSGGAINRPLESSGADFPCRRTDQAFSGPANTYPQGSKQKLSFQGSAVHGGGSCQVSITYDTQPSKSSKFKVIHTIQGGCPARDTNGNLVGTAETPNPNAYDFTIPSDLPAGKGTIAWSWMNRIGNREFYMNCGSVEITGDGGNKAAFDALPDLFVANIAGQGDCTTDSMNDKDPWIPDAGTSVEVNKGSWGYGNFTCDAAA
ncbi:hypothetical protein JX265_002016 [Neoarthrinium moseri]|uniref:Endoglucanase n=1 Tax=Neoarthrinium moseri TaxID=1658444 RepID=A0A9P9WWJ4_9PEZI|nr:uncharacterized protein JN550_005764 [Neoarthrinium moseri]KAI1848011.1 hypothetical protein JX266_006124 [Neoarthrinium moseri]KAI1869783.1 hypothetical protein JN550_005764 [Neoarthrinium moseri]KAI1880395.1 hypothetical protein JX265_002016 [Neoarthrinium moseri]